MSRAIAIFVLAVALAAPGFAQEAQTILHLLDYIGVDYAEAIEDGKIKNEDEYKEMLEFTAQVSQRLKALPENQGKAALVAGAQALEKLVQDKGAAQTVADASGRLRGAIVRAYGLKLAPRTAPDVARGKALYAQHCAGCHGVDGRGDGPAGKGLEPAPSDFHDLERLAQRSAYGLYNTITLGVEGTSMASFKHLAEDDRWSLALFASVMGLPEARLSEGERLWKAGEARSVFPDLGNVVTLSANEVVARYGEKAARVQDHLRAHPEAIRSPPIEFTRRKLAEAREAYQRGERVAARNAAIQGYLEGFELVEASLANVDPSLMREIEREMLELRAAIERGEPAEAFAKRVERVDALLVAASEKLGDGSLSEATAFTASLVILLREGLEAILVLAAIIAFVSKSGRRDALPWVHAGWIAALVLGVLTWVIATFVVEISGANRELTEGVTALLAAALLLYVGYWLHGKSYAQAWTRFITEQVGQALAKRTLWAMAAVSFFAVYREMFEIVLFYQALWVQTAEAGRAPVLAGAAAAAVLLAVIGIALFKYSVRMPMGIFFGGTSALLALLAVVFTGHGVAALQEAGVIGATNLGFDPVPFLGIYPSGEALAAQLFALALVGLSFWAARRSAVAHAA